jgi:hypothetical protein
MPASNGGVSKSGRGLSSANVPAGIVLHGSASFARPSAAAKPMADRTEPRGDPCHLLGGQDFGSAFICRWTKR